LTLFRRDEVFYWSQDVLAWRGIMDGVNSTDLTPVTAYFNRFAAAFSTFDGNQVAELFAAPVVALGRDGSLVGLPTRDDVVRYYQAALDRHHGNGCCSCCWSDLSVVSMGCRSVLATVTWDLLREDGAVHTRWRQSYNLGLFGEGRLKAFAAASHAE